MTDLQPDGARAPGRLDRRKARTRTALVEAAQRLIATGRVHVSVQTITEAADLGTGSFYNHFRSKDELFRAAVADALARQAQALGALLVDEADPAVVFAQSFRLTGRMHRLQPELSKVVLSVGLASVGARTGMAASARTDVLAGVETGRFTVRDVDAVMVTVVGAALALGQLVHDRPDLDDATLADRVTEDVLRVLGLPVEEAARICALPLPVPR